MLNLNSNIELDVNKFFRWWAAELAAFIPDKLKQLISESQGIMLIKPVEGGFLLRYEQDGQSEDWVHLSVNEHGQTDAQQLMQKDERLLKARKILALNADDAISKELILPLAAAENLQQVMRYELDRYTPFKPEQVYFAVQLQNKQPELGQLNAKLIVATKDRLDSWCRDLKKLSIVPDLVEYEPDPSDRRPGYESYNLLPAWVKPKQSNLPKLVYTALWSLLFILFLGVFALPVWWQSQTVDSLQKTLKTLGKSARMVDETQSEIDRLIEASKALISEKRTAPSMLQVLDSLSELIKDDTWLTHLQFTGNKLQMRGQSLSASNLLTLLEASTLFANVRFVSPVTQDKKTGLERFQLSAEVVVESGDE